jgi:hypothetical protein
VLRYFRTRLDKFELDLHIGRHKEVRVHGDLFRALAAGHFAVGHLIHAVVIHAMAAVHRHRVTAFNHFVFLTMRWANAIRAAKMKRRVPRRARVRNVQAQDCHQAEKRCPFASCAILPIRHFL